MSKIIWYTKTTIVINYCKYYCRTLQNQVNISKNEDSKVCTTCSKSFSIITRKHCCSKCEKRFCGKCSKVSVTTKDNFLTRERVCTKCSLALEQLKAKLPLGSPFTPSKLHILNESTVINIGQSLWSADSESDSENDDRSSISSIKENLLLQISQENVLQDGNTVDNNEKGIIFLFLSVYIP